MNKDLKRKVMKNALIGERLSRLDKEERRDIIVELLQHYSEGQLSEELGIAKSTIHDWKTLRQSNKGENIHVSLAVIVRKLKAIDVKTFSDWGRLEQIKSICEEKLRKNEK